MGLGRPLFFYLQKTEHFGYKKYGISYQEINIFVSRSVATRVGCKEEKEVMRLLMTWGTGLAVFIITMMIYAVGIFAGAATLSGQLIACVAIQSIATGLVLYAFWD